MGIGLLKDDCRHHSRCGHDAFLGVSLNNPTLREKKRIKQYIDWALTHCWRLWLLVDDEEEVVNIRAFTGKSEEIALQKAIREGRELDSTFQHVINSFPQKGGIGIGKRVCRVASSDLAKYPIHAKYYNLLLQAYKEDPGFHQDVTGHVRSMRDSIRKWKELPDNQFETILPILVDYPLREMVITLQIRQTRQAPIEIHPGPSMGIMRKLYEDHYPQLANNLGLQRELYGYINLKFE